MMPYCSCAEIKDSNGNDVAFVPKWHNCEYIAKRNSLIPKAWSKAMTLAKTGSNEINSDKLTNLFSKFMDESARKEKIV